MSKQPLSTAERFSLRRFFKGEKPYQHAITLNHRRIFILPSKQGFVLALLILLMLIASINYNNSLGFIFTFLLASAAQISSFYSYKNLSGLSINSIKPEPCFLTDKANYQLMVKETEGRERWAIWLRVGERVHHIKHLQAYQSLALSIEVTPKKRGLFSPGTLTFYSYFPFDLFRAWSPLQFEQKILVYPSPATSGLALPTLNVELADGEAAEFHSGVDEFYGFRSYQKGDSFRHINWKALAAEKGVFINQFTSPLNSQLRLHWSACTGKDNEQKLSQLCRWLIDAQQAGSAYSLELPTQSIDCNQGYEHQQRCLKALALFK